MPQRVSPRRRPQKVNRSPHPSSIYGVGEGFAWKPVKLTRLPSNRAAGPQSKRGAAAATCSGPRANTAPSDPRAAGWHLLWHRCCDPGNLTLFQPCAQRTAPSYPQHTYRVLSCLSATWKLSIHTCLKQKFHQVTPFVPDVYSVYYFV